MQTIERAREIETKEGKRKREGWGGGGERGRDKPRI